MALPEPVSNEAGFDSLEVFLRLQLNSLKLSREINAVCAYLIKCIDGRGYLDEDVDDTALHLGVSPGTVGEALALLRSLEPKGVCAANLTQCLLLQTEGVPDEELCREIISKHLERLAAEDYSGIARDLYRPVEDIKRACCRIKNMSPLPAIGFALDERVDYISPDISIFSNEGIIEVSVYRSFLPFLQVSPVYRKLYEECEDYEARQYLEQKIQEYEAVIKNVQQRESTLLSCARIIAETQSEFFARSDGSLEPLSLSDVAERLGVHTSTVSRAISGKYILCRGGCIPMKSFFTRRLNCELDATAESIKRMIKSIIQDEDSSAPLTDKQICQLLGKNAVSISRRTVAKYREQLNIPGAAVRKKCS